MSRIPARPGMQTGALPELPAGKVPAARAMPAAGPLRVPAGPVDTDATTAQQGPAATGVAFVDDDDASVVPAPAPSLAEIKAGKILAPGQRGEAVLQLRALLNEAGYPVPAKGENLDRFDETLEAAVGKFQLAEKLVGPESPHKGLLGPTTLKRLQHEAEEEDYDKAVGSRIAKAALRAKGSDTSSSKRCYAFAAQYIEAGVRDNFLSGRHAYMAANQLAKSPYFKEETVATKDLARLPDGAVIVYPAQSNHHSGHIDVVATHPKSGARLAISDFSRQLDPSPWRNVSDSKVKYRVFIPVDDKAR